MAKSSVVTSVDRKSNECYISGRTFTDKDIINDDVVVVDGRHCFVGYHGIPQSDAWIERNTAKIEANRVAKEKADQERDDLFGDDWD